MFHIKAKTQKNFLLNNKKEFFSKNFGHILLENGKAFKGKLRPTTSTLRTTDYQHIEIIFVKMEIHFRCICVYFYFFLSCFQEYNRVFFRDPP